MDITQELLNQMGDPAWEAGFLAALQNYGGLPTFAKALVEVLHEKNAAIQELAATNVGLSWKYQQMASMIDNDMEVSAPCVCCGEYTLLFCNIEDFDPKRHYCGRSPRCCP